MLSLVNSNDSILFIRILHSVFNIDAICLYRLPKTNEINHKKDKIVRKWHQVTAQVFVYIGRDGLG